MTQFLTSLGKLIELAKGMPYEHIAKDERALERMFLETLKNSGDPMLREIGGGTMTWRRIATHSAYAEFDGGVVTEELGREREKAAKEEQQQRDPEDLFRGGVLKRRKQ